MAAPPTPWQLACDEFLGDDYNVKPRFEDTDADVPAASGEWFPPAAGLDVAALTWMQPQMDRLALQCRTFNAIDIPYAALLGMSHDIDHAIDMLRDEGWDGLDTLAGVVGAAPPPVYDPLVDPIFITFTDKLKGVRLTTVPLHKRALLVYLRILTADLIPAEPVEVGNGKIYNAANLGSIVNIVCDPTGIARFNISIKLATTELKMPHSALAGAHPLKTVTPPSTATNLERIVDKFYILSKALSAKFKAAAGISLQNKWNFSTNLLDLPKVLDDVNMVGGGSRRRPSSGKKKAPATKHGTSRASSPPKTKPKPRHRLQPLPPPGPRHRRSRS